MEDFVFTFLFHGFEVLVQPRRSFPGYQLSLLFRLLRICHYTQKTQKNHLGWGSSSPNSWVHVEALSNVTDTNLKETERGKCLDYIWSFSIPYIICWVCCDGHFNWRKHGTTNKHLIHLCVLSSQHSIHFKDVKLSLGFLASFTFCSICRDMRFVVTNCCAAESNVMEDTRRISSRSILCFSFTLI